MKRPIALLRLLVLAAVLALSACGGGGGGGTSSAGSAGTLQLALADAPACGYDAVYVTVLKVRVNQSSSAADTDPGWVDIVPASGARVDLLSLSNGVLTTLGQTALPAGKYTQIELVLAANGSGPPFANAVVPTGGSETALTTPSAQQSGLKINADITVTANQQVDFLLDFNACKSIVKAGNSGKYLLKPVLTVTPLYLSGISGFVDPSLANASTLVTAQQNGVVLAGTIPAASGAFTLSPLAPGNYDLVIVPAGHASAVETSVPVMAAQVTAVNTGMTAFNPAPSALGAVDGTVTTAAAPILADVQVSQILAGAHPIEIADATVDADTGAYAYSLPLAAPVTASYVPIPAVPVFASDTTATAQYVLAASSGGLTKAAPVVTLTSAATTVVNFTFP